MNPFLFVHFVFLSSLPHHWSANCCHMILTFLSDGQGSQNGVHFFQYHFTGKWRNRQSCWFIWFLTFYFIHKFYVVTHLTNKWLCVVYKNAKNNVYQTREGGYSIKWATPAEKAHCLGPANCSSLASGSHSIPFLLDLVRWVDEGATIPHITQSHAM